MWKDVEFVNFVAGGVTVFILMVAYFWWSDRRAGKLTFPGLKPTDEISGNLEEIRNDGGLHRFLLKNHKKYGEMFFFYWKKEVTVSIASPFLWQSLQTLFNRPENQHALFKPLVGEHSLFYMNSPFGQQHRQLLDRHFDLSAMRLHFAHFNQATKDMVERCSLYSSEENVPFHQHLLTLVGKSLIQTICGCDFLKSDKDISNFLCRLEQCWQHFGIQMYESSHECNSVENMSFNQARDDLRKQLQNIVEHSRHSGKHTGCSLLEVMLQNKDLYPHDEQIVDMLITYLSSGIFHVRNLLLWAFYFIATHPSVEKKLLIEIQEVLGGNVTKYDSVVCLKYTKQVLNETLRCAVLEPCTSRYCDSDIFVNEQHIPKYTPVLIALGAILQNEKLYPEPKRFDPDRFSSENEQARRRLSFEPFGFAGQRKCPGSNFTYNFCAVILTGMLRAFKLKLVEERNLETGRLFMLPEIWFQVEKRKEMELEFS